MIIDGMEKVTLVNYPGYVACIVFTRGCNFACPWCQNSPLIPINKHDGLINNEDVFAYLRKRKGILDGICISGGEPTLQPDLKDFIKEVKKLKLLVKLDTNGSNPKLLKELIDEHLIDYVAMDIKNVPDKYARTIGREKYNALAINESINLLKENKIDYEFRTTIIKEYHSIDDIKSLCELTKGSKYFLQNFVDSDNVLEKNLHGFSYQELDDLKKKLESDYPNISIR